MKPGAFIATQGLLFSYYINELHCDITDVNTLIIYKFVNVISIFTARISYDRFCLTV